MPLSLAQNLQAGLHAILKGLTTLGRLRALELLAAPGISEMENSARSFANTMDVSLRIETFLVEFYQSRPTPVHWSRHDSPIHSGVLKDRAIQARDLQAKLVTLSRKIGGRATTLLSHVQSATLAAPALPLLKEILAGLPFATPNGEDDPLEEDDCIDTKPHKELEGPLSTATDPIFTKAYSLRDFDAPHFGDDQNETIPYFWTLANREALASQLCALSAVEYGGLPTKFYWDMGKQSWDEARHAQYFLETALKLIPWIDEVRQGTEKAHPWLSLNEFRSTGWGLPIPHEGNLYESMLNADLVERLVLMNYRTEAPAVGRIAKRIKSAFCHIHQDVAEGYEFDKIDERSHAIIGKRWLEYLIPDASDRQSRIEDSDLLRNILVLTSFSHHGGGTMSDLLAVYTAQSSDGTDSHFLH
jgi:hypothetical protein